MMTSRHCKRSARHKTGEATAGCVAVEASGHDRWPRSLRLLATTSMCGFLVGTVLAAREADPLAENQARFGRITGSVDVLPQGAADWLQAQTDLPIEVGDQIRLDTDSSAELSVAPHAFWLVEGPAVLVMGRTTLQEGRLMLREGTIVGKVDPSQGRLGKWNFETPLAVCGVRGTEFILTHSEAEGTHLGVARGAVEFGPAETSEGFQPPVLIQAPNAGILQKLKPTRQIGKWSAPLQAHSARLTLVRQRYQEAAGVWTPFTTTYRKELRSKVVPAVKPKKRPPQRPGARPRRPQNRKRS